MLRSSQKKQANRMLKNPKNQLISAFFGLCLVCLCFAPSLSAADHYLCDSQRSISDLELSRWFSYEFPVRVYIPPVPYAVKDPQMYIPLVQNAFQSWTRLAPFAKFTFVDAPKKANIVIEWKSDFTNENAWGKAYYPQIYVAKRKILRHRSIVYLAVRAQLGSGMSITEPVLFSYDELLSIAKHEVGHALGLNHSKTEGDVMCGGCWGFMGNAIRDITAHDIQTLNFLYSLPVKIKKNPCKS
jgi:predicted Zn-dependent protease